MPAKGKELRAHVKPEIHAWIMAAAKARRTSPATIINELVEVQLGVMPQLADILPLMRRAHNDGDRIGVIRDFVIDTQQERDDALARMVERLDLIETHLDTAFKWLANSRKEIGRTMQ